MCRACACTCGGGGRGGGGGGYDASAIKDHCVLKFISMHRFREP